MAASLQTTRGVPGAPALCRPDSDFSTPSLSCTPSSRVLAEFLLEPWPLALQNVTVFGGSRVPARTSGWASFSCLPPW